METAIKNTIFLLLIVCTHFNRFQIQVMSVGGNAVVMR